MTRGKRDFLNWFAGFIDGEGSIGIYGHGAEGRGSYYLSLKISQIVSREWILNYIAEEMGGMIYYNPSSNSAQLTWHGRKALKVIRAVAPYLRVKRDQVNLLLKGMKSWTYGNHRWNPISPEQVALRTKLANSVNAFNLNNGIKAKPSQAVDAVYEANDAEGVTVIHESRKGRDDLLSQATAS